MRQIKFTHQQELLKDKNTFIYSIGKILDSFLMKNISYIFKHHKN